MERQMILPGGEGPDVYQRGSTLIVSLVMLLLLSLIGVAGMQNTILQNRMTGNLQDRELAFQASEAAIREAEAWLGGSNPPREFSDNANGLYEANAANRPDWPADLTSSGIGGGVVTYGKAVDRVAKKPVYFIEELSSIQPPGTDLAAFNETKYYRVTALGYGGSENTGAVITTVFKDAD